MGRLLLRAADGDEKAAEDFWALRALFAEAQERSRNLARRQAWQMINSPYRLEEPKMTAIDIDNLKPGMLTDSIRVIPEDAEPLECRACGEPVDANGRIVEHRPGTPCTTDYRAI